jgi:integrase
MHLTELCVRALKAPAKGQITYWDKSLPGFGLRVSQGGTKTWTVMHGKRRRRISLGRHPLIGLGVARAKAKCMLADAMLSRYHNTVTFGEAVSQFLTIHCKHNRPNTFAHRQGIIRKYFLPKLIGRQLADIDKRDLIPIFDGMLEYPALACSALTIMKTFFRWCISRDYISNSPCEGLRPPKKSTSRSRVLSDTEIGLVWTTARQIGYPFGTIVRLLLLSAQRRTEVANFTWKFIDLQKRTVSLPATLTKNKREHFFPYGPLFATVLDEIPRRGEILFSLRTSTPKPFSSWAIAKDKFDALCPIDHWTLHDLRRTAATNLAELGTAPHVVERLLNHVGGTISGVAAIYNRFAYLEEMRDAVAKWERKIQSIDKALDTEANLANRRDLVLQQHPSVLFLPVAKGSPDTVRGLRIAPAQTSVSMAQHLPQTCSDLRP